MRDCNEDDKRALDHAVETVHVYTEAFQAFIDDINSSSVDMRIFTKETIGKLRAAGESRKELLKLIDINRAKVTKLEGERH